MCSGRLKYDAICALLLYDEPSEDGSPLDLANVNPDLPSSGNGVLWRFFDWIDKGAFEVSADAFNTFRVWAWSDVSGYADFGRKSSPSIKLW